MRARVARPCALRRSARAIPIAVLAAAGALWAPGVPAAEAAGTRLDRAEQAVVRAINHARSAHGLAPLRADWRLQRAADAHCRDMLRADFFAHSSSDGTPMTARVSRYRPSRRLGETLAVVQGSRRRAARRVVSSWMASPGHRAAILSDGFRRVGVARRRGRLGSRRAAVYTADFASRR